MSLRAPMAVVNELSLPPNSPFIEPVQVPIILGELVALTRALQRVRPDLALASVAPLGTLPLTADGIAFSALAEIEGGLLKEQWRYIQTRRNIAPLNASSILQFPGLDEEYRVDGDVCIGLGVAVSTGQISVSFQTQARWDADQTTVVRTRLSEDESTGNLVEEVTSIDLPHASRPTHAEVHYSFVADLALPEPFAGSDLWADRKLRYPHLQFLPSVENQLRVLGLGSTAVSQVHRRLSELESATSTWNPASAVFPEWESKVTPESDQRKKLCVWTDVDGVSRCFDLHARFTPGAGRVHMRLVPEQKAVRIAYVGRKLEG